MSRPRPAPPQPVGVLREPSQTFDRWIDAGRLAEIKWRTNEIEGRFIREDGGRRVNRGPGYLSQANLALATGKGYTHRPYSGSGIHADLTLIRQWGVWRDLPWTFPYCRSEETKAVLSEYRELYRRKPTEIREREAKT